MRFFRYLVCAAMVAAMAVSASAEESERYGKQKVVYHINYDGGPESKAYKGAMRNIQNHINAVGAENMEIAVVLHGNGLGLLMSATSDDALQTAVASLKGQNVGFQVCNNTLKGRKISYEDDLYDVWEQDIVRRASPNSRGFSKWATPTSSPEIRRVSGASIHARGLYPSRSLGNFESLKDAQVSLGGTCGKSPSAI